MEQIGPVDYAVIAFPGNQFKGEIAPALAELTDSGTIRIIDVAFVGKSAGGDTVAMELTELDPQVQASLDKLGIEVGGLFNEDDLQDIADDLEPNFSAAVLLWENVWARKVTKAMRGVVSPRRTIGEVLAVSVSVYCRSSPVFRLSVQML